MKSINPANGQLLKEFSNLDLTGAIQAAQKTVEAQKNWRKLELTARTPFAQNLAKVLRENLNEYAQLMSLEMGKPITQARAEVEKCAWLCEHYAKESENYLRPIEIKTDYAKSYVRFDPLGVVLCVMPWNFPFWQIIRCAVPALMVGNGVLLKHASNVPQCALAIHDAFKRAGFPENIFQTLLIDGPTASALIADDSIAAVSLTGSTQAGAKVAEAAGRALKKCVLELGGSDPFIICADADLQKAATTALTARMQNAGQSCIAAKRFLVHSSRVAEFEQKITELFKTIVVGDPLDEKTTLGPVATPAFAEQLQDQVDRSVKAGAQVVHGGTHTGALFEPTLLKNMGKDIAAWNEETFGPIFTFMTFETEDEAIAVANSSEYGLGASVWSSDIERAQKIAAQIDSGTVAINAMVKSDPRLPFGGVKRSGFGREMGEFGIKEFTNTKTITIA